MKINLADRLIYSNIKDSLWNKLLDNQKCLSGSLWIDLKSNLWYSFEDNLESDFEGNLEDDLVSKLDSLTIS